MGSRGRAKIKAPEPFDGDRAKARGFLYHLFLLFELEKNLSIAVSEQPIYVIYPDETGGQWRVQAVPVSSQSFESRKALPEAWRGLRDGELSKASKVDGCVFVHASGFIGGTSPVASPRIVR